MIDGDRQTDGQTERNKEEENKKRKPPVCAFFPEVPLGQASW